MTQLPAPFVCDPIFKDKPWGGRRLAERFGKSLPPDVPIGESWELVSLPDNESRVRRGPLAGQTLRSLVDQWGTDLLGHASPVGGRFPLLIKFLDARQHLSVQVHPKPLPGDQANATPGLKHEAWYVLDAEPDAALFIGLKPGVTAADVTQAANTPAFADLLRRWPVKPGDCYYLPSGTVHALGAGIMVAEVQTPSDVTYRFYDWDRMGLDGKPRSLHIEEALANTRYGVPDAEIAQPQCAATTDFCNAIRRTSCERFTIDRVKFDPGADMACPGGGELRIWIALQGELELSQAGVTERVAPGDVAVLPASCADTWVRVEKSVEFLEIRIPHS